MMSTTRANKAKAAKSSQAQNAKSDGTLNMKNQPTPEQLRIAEMTDKNDDVIERQLKQVTELTGRDKDAALLALHDCDYDLNRAVERLLENEADLGEWQDAPTKKKRSQVGSKVQNTEQSNSKSVEKSDQSHDRDGEKEREKDSAPRGRRERGPPRFNRGRGRENQDDNRNDSRSRDRGFSERGRGRGRTGSRGRGSGRGGSSARGGFSGRERNQTEQGPEIDTWTNETANKQKDNSIGAWGDMMENDWQLEADEWTGKLDGTKIFTASNSTENKAFPAVNDNDATMFTPAPNIETQVFTATSLANSANAVSTLSDSGSSSYQQNPINQGAIPQNSFGQRLDLDILLPPKSTDSSAVNSSQSSFMTQFAKQAEESIKTAVGITSSPNLNNQHVNNQSIGGPPGMGANPGLTSQSLSVGSQPTAVTATARTSGYVGGPTQSQPAPQRAKPQRSKLPPPSKIPASAVEMPGSMNFNVDIQFGNWADSGFSFGGSQSDASISTTIPSSSSPAALSNHLPSISQSTAPSNADPAILSNSSMVTTAADSPLDNMGSMAPTSSQSPRPSMFQNSTPATPPKDYSQGSLSQQAKISSALDPITFPGAQPDRKSTYGSQRSTPGSMSNSNNPVSSAPMSFSESGYSGSSYQSAPYKSTAPPLTTATYSSSHTNSALQSAQYGSGSTYQNSSFQGQSSNFSNDSQSSALYANTSNQTNSFQSGTANTGSSYQSQGSTASYEGQSTYHRNSQSTGSAYQPSNSQSVVSYPQTSTAYQTTGSQSSGNSYQRDSRSGQTNFSQSYGSAGVQNTLQTSPLSTSKLTDSLSKMNVKDTTLDSATASQFDQNSVGLSLTSTTTTTSSSLASGSMSVPSALGLGAAGGTAATAAPPPPPSSSTATSSSASVPSKPVTSKAPPNLPQGVPPLIGHNYMVGQHGIPLAAFGLTPGLAQQPIYSIEELQLLQQQQRLLPGYGYDMQFQPPTTLTNRDQTPAALTAAVPYTGATDAGKLNRVEAQSPVTVPASQPPQPQAQSVTATHQQTFINAATLQHYPNYAYYPPAGVLPGGYSYQPTVFPMPAVTNAAHAGTTGTPQFQKTGAYSSFGTGYSDTTAAGGVQDFKTYGGVSQTQIKGSTTATGVVSTSTDLTAPTYGKTHSQSYDKSGYHGGTPPPFNLMPTGTQAGPMGAAPAPYGTPYMPVMPHSGVLHHHLPQDSSTGSSRSTGPNSSQNKAAVAATAKNYSTAYWGPN